MRIRLSDGKAGVDKAVAAALSAHAEGAYNPDAMLVIEAGALGRESALRKAAEGFLQAQSAGLPGKVTIKVGADDPSSADMAATFGDLFVTAPVSFPEDFAAQIADIYGEPAPQN